MTKRVMFYLRVSTSDQTCENQRRELTSTANKNGWLVVGEFEDKGVSGAKAHEDRPALKSLITAVRRRECEMVATWSVDRLGRSLSDLLDVLKLFHSNGVDLFLHQQGLDTSTPSGRAMFQMLGVFAEFERSLIRERVLAGLARAKSCGKRLGRRPLESVDAGKVAEIREMLRQGSSPRLIAKSLQCGVGTVMRLRAEETAEVA
jgi:DNA invertase Pin-like site-specific DNA recombinase